MLTAVCGNLLSFALFYFLLLPFPSFIFQLLLPPPVPSIPPQSRQLEAEPLNGDNWGGGAMVGPCLTNLLTQQSADCSRDLVTQQPPIA